MGNITRPIKTLNRGKQSNWDKNSMYHPSTGYKPSGLPLRAMKIKCFSWVHAKFDDVIGHQKNSYAKLSKTSLELETTGCTS